MSTSPSAAIPGGQTQRQRRIAAWRCCGGLPSILTRGPAPQRDDGRGLWNRRGGRLSRSISRFTRLLDSLDAVAPQSRDYGRRSPHGRYSRSSPLTAPAAPSAKQAPCTGIAPPRKGGAAVVRGGAVVDFLVVDVLGLGVVVLRGVVVLGVVVVVVVVVLVVVVLGVVVVVLVVVLGVVVEVVVVLRVVVEVLRVVALAVLVVVRSVVEVVVGGRGERPRLGSGMSTGPSKSSLSSMSATPMSPMPRMLESTLSSLLLGNSPPKSDSSVTSCFPGGCFGSSGCSSCEGSKGSPSSYCSS